MYSVKRRSAKRKNQRGVSLVEALVTMGIMGVGVLGMSASAVELSRTAKWADMASAATSLATERLELIRSLPLGSAGHTPGSYTAGTMQANGTASGPYTVSWVVSPEQAPMYGVRRVIVTTSWTQYNKARRVQMGALVRCTTTPCS